MAVMGGSSSSCRRSSLLAYRRFCWPAFRDPAIANIITCMPPGATGVCCFIKGSTQHSVVPPPPLCLFQATPLSVLCFPFSAFLALPPFVCLYPFPGPHTSSVVWSNSLGAHLGMVPLNVPPCHIIFHNSWCYDLAGAVVVVVVGTLEPLRLLHSLTADLLSTPLMAGRSLQH